MDEGERKFLRLLLRRGFRRAYHHHHHLLLLLVSLFVRSKFVDRLTSSVALTLSLDSASPSSLFLFRYQPPPRYTPSNTKLGQRVDQLASWLHVACFLESWRNPRESARRNVSPTADNNQQTVVFQLPVPPSLLLDIGRLDFRSF